jgi:hypothetical protein
MKKFILALSAFISVFIGNAQIIEIQFDQFIAFNSGKVSEYEELLNSKNYVVKEDHSGLNKYVINLNDKKMYRYFSGFLSDSSTILTVSKKKDLIYLTIEDTETSTGKKITANVVLNTDKDDLKHPQFMHYFLSTVTNTINGHYSVEPSLKGK